MRVNNHKQITSISVPIIVGCDKTVLPETERSYVVEIDELIAFKIRVYNIANYTSKPVKMTLKANLPEELYLAPNTIYLGDELLQGDIREGIELPKNLNETELKVSLLGIVKKSIQDHFEVEMILECGYQVRANLPMETIRAVSKPLFFEIIKPCLEINCKAQPNSELTMDVFTYTIYMYNTGSVPLKNIELRYNLLSGMAYVKGSLWVDGEIVILEEEEERFLCEEIKPDERIEIRFEVIVMGQRLESHEMQYLQANFEYDRGEIQHGISYSNPIVLDQQIPLIVQNEVTQEVEQDTKCQTDIQNISVLHKGEIIRGKVPEIIRFMVSIENKSQVYLQEIYMLYTLHYKLRVLADTLKVNDCSIKGNLENLRLPPLEAKGRKNAKTVIEFCAYLNQELTRREKSMIQNRVRLKYLNEQGKMITTKPTCLKMKIGVLMKPIEISKTILLTKEYPDIYRIQSCELKICHVQEVNKKLSEVIYEVRVVYLTNQEKTWKYKYKDKFEMTLHSSVHEVYGILKNRVKIYNERSFQINAIFYPV